MRELSDSGALFETLTAALAQRRALALATVIATRGSSAADLGAKLLIDADGIALVGWIGGGCAQQEVCRAARQALIDRQCRTLELDLESEVLGAGMPCGGWMRVFVEPLVPPPRLWVVGQGALAGALAQAGRLAGFAAVLIGEGAPVAGALQRREPPAPSEIEPADAAVVATQHRGDHLVLPGLLRSPAGYIGLIASRHRAGLVRDYLAAAELTPAQLARLHAPAGLALGGRTPGEIALSVLSQILAQRQTKPSATTDES